MYLYDYQRTQIRKIRSGGNYIVHGSRGIGITSILLNCALVQFTDTPGAEVLYICKNQESVSHTHRMVFDILYAAKTGNTSVFDSSLDIKAHTQNKREISFTNGSVLSFSTLSENSIRGIDTRGIDLLIIDDPNNLVEQVDLFKFRKTLIGLTGAFDKNSPLYRLYLNSLRGKNNFEYIRLPWELSPHIPKDIAHMPTDQFNNFFELLSNR